MKILLISYYWYPWNNSGSFRWLHLSKYLDIHTVLTCKRPRNSFLDKTIPRGRTKKVIRLFRLRPILWSIAIIPIVAILLLNRYSKVVVSSPPEMSITVAWLVQILGKCCVLDIRDMINRESQSCKKLIPFYQWFYNKIKNVCVCMQFFDPTKQVIRHGYDDIFDKDEQSLIEY